ncbi:MAG: universal stress protein [Polyangiales bacterium]
MPTIKTILCPTDFSECSTASVGMAIELAKRLGARVQLLHVFQLPQYVGWEEGMAMVAATPGFLEELRKGVDQQLAKQIEAAKQAGIDVVAEQVDGVAFREIVDRSAKADLVVMGTHGRTGLPRLMLGSVAERVVRLSKCPVLTVPAPEKT